MGFTTDLRKRAKALHRHIILAEADDPRVLKAAAYLGKENICRLTLLGEPMELEALAQAEGITLPKGVTIISPATCKDKSRMSEHLYRRCQHKGMTLETAREMLSDRLYLAAGLVATGFADAFVAGSIATTGEVIKSAVYSIGLQEDITIVSSIFMMVLPNGRPLTYADCGVVPYPDAVQLADVAIESARTHKLLTGEKPVVAMLSFSTKGSAQHPSVDKVREALAIAQRKEPKLAIDGEFQFDAAFVPDVARRKAPDSKVAGNANVFIFPNLDAANIAYKITERLGGASATGPILQGLAKPVMDLSRGCSWQDIVNAACVAAVMA